jgi:hypothetical protein
MPIDHDLGHPSLPAKGVLTPRQAAMIAGAAYLITDVTSIFAEFYVRPTLIAGGDAARTASNIVAHAQLFRVGVVSDVLTSAGLVILNLALYELLVPVHRTLARLAAWWRLVEVAVGGAVAVSGFMVLSLLSGTDYVQAFPPYELEALVRLLIGAQASGYLIVLLFFGLGSTTYMYLLVKSRYVPRALAFLGLGGSALVVLFVLARMLFPALFVAATAAVRALPAVALASLALVFVPILSFEVTLGLWLLVKGVRVPEQA